jgi:hypothetical protein
MNEQPDRAAVLQLVKRIFANTEVGGTEEERSSLLMQLKQSVPHPQVSDLIFWPDLCGYDRDLTPEEITDIALSYKRQTKD